MLCELPMARAWSLVVFAAGGLESLPVAFGQSGNLAVRLVARLESFPCRPNRSLFLRRMENFPAKPVNILAGKARVNAKRVVKGTADLLRLVLTARRAEAGQGANRPLDNLVAVHIAVEPGEVRWVALHDFGEGLASVLAERHFGFFGHIIFIGVRGGFFGVTGQNDGHGLVVALRRRLSQSFTVPCRVLLDFLPADLLGKGMWKQCGTSQPRNVSERSQVALVLVHNGKP